MIVTSLLALLLSLQPGASVEDLRWLSGCWEFTTGSRTVTEYWLPPKGGTMLGLSRTVSGGRTVEWEFVLLRAGTNGLEYVARPSGQAEAVFTSTSVRADEVVFENPAHDFPQRITYRRTSEGLSATIGGTMKQQARNIEFRYTPADCSR
jgi:hypothetical protein